jgi:hypothetical protein
MARPLAGEKPMSAAERQRRRRARLPLLERLPKPAPATSPPVISPPADDNNSSANSPSASIASTAEIEIPEGAEAMIAICRITAAWSEADRARLIAVLDQQQRRAEALSTSPTVTVSWSAINAAKQLCQILDIVWLDRFCEGLANGKIPRMSIAEKQRLWGTTNGLMPKTIELDASDPAAAAQRILCYWGHRGKIDTLSDEIKRRTKSADPERPKYRWSAQNGVDGEDDIPF